MELTNPQEAARYFEEKLRFTTGPIELNSMISNDENISIIDVRQYEDYVKGHIPKAVNLPHDKWQSCSGLNKDKVNVIYCYSEVCHLAANGCRFFAEKGFSVMELQGGFDQWKTHNLPIASAEYAKAHH